MSDNTENLIWIDITPDFDPVAYAKEFAEDTVVEALDGADSIEAALICLYENGYLSKRDGKIQYLVPEDSLEEMKLGDLSKGYKRAREAGMGRMAATRVGAKGAWGAMPKGAKIGAGVAGAVGGAALATGTVLGARAIYKKMKARRARKKNETLDDQDIEFLLDEAELLGFDFDTLEELGETIDLGAYIDDILLNAANEGLLEDSSEEDIIEAILSTLDEGERWEKVKGAFTGAAGRAKDYGKQAKQAYQYSRGGDTGRIKSAAKVAHGAWQAMGTKGKVGVAAGAGAALAGAGLGATKMYKGMKRRKQRKESIGETLDAQDLEAIVTESKELGFEFETYDELIEALQLGELFDAGFEFYLDGDLTETSEEDDFAIMEAILADLDESALRKAKALAKRYAGRDARSQWKSMKNLAKGSLEPLKGATSRRLVATGASKMSTGAQRIGMASKLFGKKAGKYGKHYAKTMSDVVKSARATVESVEFTGYRSSAQGGLYETLQAPIPYGTGNHLYDRIRKDLLETEDGQKIVNNL